MVFNVWRIFVEYKHLQIARGDTMYFRLVDGFQFVRCKFGVVLLTNDVRCLA